jgi:hypothetical protein
MEIDLVFAVRACMVVMTASALALTLLDLFLARRHPAARA